MTTAEYLNRLKKATEQKGQAMMNFIYGLDGQVYGNVQELLKVAELLLQERDEAVKLLKKFMRAKDDTNDHDEPWGDHPAVDKEQLLFKVAGNPSDSDIAGER